MLLPLLAASLTWAASFPPCAPQPGWAWCPAAPDAFFDGLPPAAQDELEAALQSLFSDDLLPELAGRAGAESAADLDEMRRAVAQARGRLWKETVRGELVSIQPLDGEVIVTAHPKMERLFGGAVLARIRQRHQGLGCDPDFTVFLDMTGRLLRVNPYQGSCHDANE